MRKTILCSMLLIAGLKCASQTIATPYEIGTWEDFRTSAISYTFDDNLEYQYSRAIPALDEVGYKATFFTVTNWSPNWATLKAMAANGHEIASHSVSHPNFSTLNDSLQTIELAASQALIDKNIDNQKCVTHAYPYCVPGNNAITSKYYISARHCQGFIEGSTPTDFLSVSSVICGSLGATKTIADFKSKINEAVATKGWCVFLIHELDNGSGYSPLSSSVLKSSLYYCKIRNYKVWVSTFANVSKYIKERNAASLTEVAANDSLVVQITDTLDNTLYNYPITVRRPLPVGWEAVTISQHGKPVKVRYVKNNTAVYAMFSVVPNGGDIILKKHTEVIEAIDQQFEATDTVGSTPAAIKTASVNTMKLQYTNGSLTFELPSKACSHANIAIYNTVGLLLMSHSAASVIDGKGNVLLADNNLSSGLCFVNIHNGQSSWTKALFIK